jgi:signal transduction histidine kinase
MIARIKYSPFIRNLFLILAFGALSQLLGKIQFYLPGMEGGMSDMREIAILFSVVYFPHWIYLIGVSFITSLSHPPDIFEVSTFLMHSTAGIFAWLSYAFIRKRISNVYYLGICWAGMVILYYSIFLIPTMVIVYHAYELISKTDLFPRYKEVLIGFRFELFTSTAVTTLFVILHRFSEILKARNIELQHALAKSEESDRLKSAFLANINHEIRTPMNGIIGFSELLADPDIPADLRETYGKMVVTSSHQLLSIINNILDISQIESGQAKVNHDTVSLNELFDNISLLYTPMAQEKQINFQIIKLPDNDPGVIVTDREKLQQILDNLLDNAFKFIRNGKIMLGYAIDAKEVRFYVEDTGPGIEAIQKERIFQSFTKINTEKERLFEGTGLGLAISKALVELLGGTIMVSSEPGRGSVFSFTLPCRKG